MQKANIKEIKSKETFIVLIILVLLFLFLFFTIKVIGRITVQDYASAVLGTEDTVNTVSPNTNKPQDIYINPAERENSSSANGNSSNTNTNTNTNTSNTNTNTNTNTSNGSTNTNTNSSNGNTNTNSNTNNNNTNTNSQNENNTSSSNTTTDDNNTGFYVTDTTQTWEQNSILPIFQNPLYSMAARIAPGSTNAYAFNLVNNNEFAVKCDIGFDEDNIYGINMKYRLKQNGTYICGNSSTWVTYAELQLSGITLSANTSLQYVLEWKWIDSANDTAIGKTGNVQYSITINIYAEQI